MMNSPVRMTAVLLAMLTAAVVSGRLAAADPADAKDAAALKKGLVENARKTYEEDFTRFKALELASGEELYRWSRRWLDAELDVAAGKDERVAAQQRHLDRMKELERMAKAYAASGQGRQSEATAATYYRIQAELWLMQAQVK